MISFHRGVGGIYRGGGVTTREAVEMYFKWDTRSQSSSLD